EANGETPLIVPVGLNFSSKGRFRSTVFVKIGQAINIEDVQGSQEDNQVKALTSTIYKGLDAVTLNVDSHEELDFIKAVERFFALRHGKYRQRSLELRFRGMKKLAAATKRLNEQYPEKIAEIKRQLGHFERMCRHWDIRDYHLTLKYRPTLVTRFLIRSLFILFVIFPLGVWGIINSFIPFFLTRWVSLAVSKDTDQYDTAKMVFGLILFAGFWGGQTTYILNLYGQTPAIIYAISLIPASAAAIMLRNERRRLLENMRVFFLFLRKRKLRSYMETRRKNLERELAQLVRLVKRKTSN
ncbi:MAG: hypothetical protein OEZ33_11375, partial [Gammaproteobacteria bacterium]|nr:hypothetical protein [Gammaproteobacteria bacterium]